ncbi:unnamed protein product [Soboliphyme baturini]|uniref:Clathrin light chain n=1 Tax=Soboliphyme baturini TaxID=241478 RepID=A0A183II34_9BILA|nr:unnamed protein product [Soboliphyme baturini]
MADETIADFLAREKEELAGLEDVPVVNGTGIALFERQNGDTNDDNLFGIHSSSNNVGAGDGDDSGLFTADSLPQNAEATKQPSGVAAPEVVREVPKKILKWKEEQKSRLESKDAKEEAEKQKWREQAKAELEEWYKTRADQLEAVKKSNRVAEAEFVKKIADTQPGQEWERIASMCEFSPKSSKNVKDVSRMRSLLLQLKTKPLVREQ